MNFSVSFEMQGVQVAPLDEIQRTKLEDKVYKCLKDFVEVVAVDNNLVLRTKNGSLAVDLLP